MTGRRIIAWSDVFIGAAIVTGGVGTVALMAYPIIAPRQLERPSASSSASAARVAFERRWASLPQPLPDAPPLAKADRLTMGPAISEAKPFGPVAGLLQPPLGEETSSVPPPVPIEQARERKVFEDDVQQQTREYQRAAARRLHDEEPRDVCARHGMHKRYFHTHHGRHLSWRCVGRGR